MTMTSARVGVNAVRRGGAMRKTLIALGVVVAIVVGLVVAAPTILSGFVGGMIEGSLNQGIAGKVKVAKISLSWTGPQRIGSIALDDPSGGKVGEVSARIDAGLLGLVTGSRSLGLIRVRGLLDLRHEKDGELNLAAATAGTARNKPITVPPGGAPPTRPGAPSEVRLPKNLAFQIDASELEIRYTPPGPTPTPVGFKTTKAAGVFAAGKPVDFELEAQTLDGRHALSLDFHADRLTDDQGLLALHDAKMELSADGELPADYADALATTGTPTTHGGVTVGPPPDGGMTLTAKFASHDGRIVLADPDKPATITGRVPDSLLRLIPVGDARVHIDVAPRATIGIQRLNLPLPKVGSLLEADFRDAVLDIGMSTDPVTGTATLDGGEPKPFKIDAIQPTLRQMDRLFDQLVTFEVDASFADMQAGKIQVDLRAAGMLDDKGRLRIGPFAPKGAGYTLVPGPEYLRGMVRVFQFPSALLQPLVQNTGIKLEEVAGPTLAMDLRTGVRQGTDELPKEVTTAEGQQFELPPVGQPYLAVTLDSRFTTAWIDLILDAERLKTRNQGIKVQTDAAAALLRPFLPADGPTLQGNGKMIVELADVDIPMTGATPDLRAAAGNYRIVLGDLSLQTAPDVSPLQLDSLDTAVGLSPNKTPTWGVDWRATREGTKFAIVGNGDLIGMIPGPGVVGDFYGLSLRDARPTGKLELLDIPTSVATLISERAAEIAGAAAGASLKGTIESSKWTDSGAHVDVAIQGDKGVMQGAFDADTRAIKFDDKGLTITLFDPGPLLNVLSEGGKSPPPLTFDDTGRASLTISGTTIPLHGLASDTPLKGVAASAKLAATDLRGTVRSDNRTAPLTFKSLDVGVSLTPAGDLTLEMTSDGNVGAEPTTSSGTLAIRKLRTPDGRIDLAGASLDGSWKARNVPTSLVALVDPDQAEIIRKTVGDSIDVALTPESGGASRGGWDVEATGSGFTLNSRIALGQSKLVIGPTSAHATLTPGAVDAAMAAYQPALTPRPRLDAPVPLDLSGDALSIALQRGYRPDLSGGLALAGSLRTGGDLVLTGLPTVEKGATSTLGIRALQVSAKPSGNQTDVSLSSEVFDPATKRVVATLTGSTSLPMSTLSGELSINDADTAALDTMLATNGLLSEVAGDRLTLNVKAVAPKRGETVPLVARVESPRLKGDAELKRADEGIELTRPARVTWLVTKKAADRLLLPATDANQQTIHVDDDFNVTLNVSALRTGPPSGPLKAGVLRLASEFSIGPIDFVSAKDGQRMKLPPSKGRLSVDPLDGSATFLLQGVGGGESGDADAKGTLSVNATINGYADASGAPTLDKARVTSTVKGQLPSPLIDSLASTDGLLTALVGPSMKADIQTNDFSERAGTGSLKADVHAEYADLRIEGKMTTADAGPVFATTAPGEAKLTRITSEASERLLGVLFPLLTRFEKTASDEPAVITAEGLTLPLSHDTRALNGVLKVDPGTMEFQTKGFFSQILKKTHNVQAGKIGQKLQPFDITIKHGVASYSDVVIPTGQFEFVTTGTVNLNKRTMDVYLYVPLVAVNDKLGTVFLNVPGLGNLSRVPIHVQGDYDSPSITPDVGKLLKTLPQNVGEGVEDILKTPGNILDKLFRNGGNNPDKKNGSNNDDAKQSGKNGAGG